MSELDLVVAIKQKMGFQSKVIYCKECDFSVPNPDRTDRGSPLMCIKFKTLVKFPVMKMSTCGNAEVTVKSNESISMAAPQTEALPLPTRSDDDTDTDD